MVYFIVWVVDKILGTFSFLQHHQIERITTYREAGSYFIPTYLYLEKYFVPSFQVHSNKIWS